MKIQILLVAEIRPNFTKKKTIFLSFQICSKNFDIEKFTKVELPNLIVRQLFFSGFSQALRKLLPNMNAQILSV